MNQKILGIFFGISAGAIWALETIIGKILFSSLTFIQVTASEILFATIIICSYTFVKRERVKLDRENSLYLLIIGVVGTVIAPLLFFFWFISNFCRKCYDNSSYATIFRCCFRLFFPKRTFE